MGTEKWLMLLINLFGGAAVLGSYAHGLRTHPGAAQVFWGGVPASIRPVYAAGMFVAAAGYFAFTCFLLFRLNPSAARVFGRFGFALFNALYAAVLIPSALWMPLTFRAVQQSSLLLLWTVRIVLVAVACASLGLLLALLNVEPRQPWWAYWAAVVGCAGFCIQTGVLDAIVWGAFFRL